MKKRLVAKTGEYQNQQNETKGEYTNIGVELVNDNGPYMLLDPSVSLAGVLAKQNTLAMNQGKPVRDMVMVSVFEDQPQQQGQQNNQQQNNQQQGYQQPQQQGYQQQGYQQK
jgi:hypothetical protein